MIPNNYYKDEIRNDFLVTSKRKKIWSIEIELLSEFDRVCQENNIKYFVSYGTLLGAIRHNGFIPWDDDIDVSVFREDYDRLIKIGAEEFKGKFYFQSYKNEKDYYRTHAQLRNSNTTAICKPELLLKRPFNQGIFIDIFPLDGYSSNEKRAKRTIKKLSKLKGILAGYEYYKYYAEPSKKGKIKLILLSIINKRFIIWLYNHYCKKEKCRRSELVSDMAFYPEKAIVWEKNKLIDTKEYSFEYSSVLGLKEYDYYLRETYGNYLEYVKDSSSHGEIFFDTDKPYTYYLNKEIEELKKYETTEY